MYSFGGSFFCHTDIHAQPWTLFWLCIFAARTGSGCYPLAARTDCLMLFAGQFCSGNWGVVLSSIQNCSLLLQFWYA